MYLFSQVCFKVVFYPSWEFFPHMDTSPLPMKGSRCRPMLDVYGHISYKVPSRVHTYCDTEHPFSVKSEDSSHTTLHVCHFLNIT